MLQILIIYVVILTWSLFESNERSHWLFYGHVAIGKSIMLSAGHYLFFGYL